MKDKTLVVFYPYRFLDNHYARLEIDYLKKYCNVLIYEFGEFLYEEFYLAQNISVSIKSRITKIYGVIQLYQLLSNINGDVVILDQLPINSWRVGVINLTVRLNNIKILKAYNNTDTIYNSVQHNYSYRKILDIKKLTSFLMNKFYSSLSKKEDYLMVSGGEIPQKNQIVKQFTVHSWEYSNTLSSNKKTNINYKYAVLLDGAGPKFSDDRILTKEKYTLTSGEWYPALVDFIDRLELQYGVKFVISAHPKSGYGKKNSIYGDREIYYGASRELVENCEFAVTRASTATNFCVVYNKPVIFIYSNQINENSSSYNNSKSWKDSIGGKLINIDDYTLDDLDELNIKQNKYSNYMKQIVSKKYTGVPNYQILLHNIFGIKLF